MKCNNSKKRILVIGPGRRVRGGITSVILDHSELPLWELYSCRWLETYDDRNNAWKIFAAAWALIQAPFLIDRCNIVHIHVAFCTSVYRKFLFFFIARLFRKKIVLHLHAPDPTPFYKFPQSYFIKKMFRESDVIIALSESWKCEILKIEPQSNVVVIPNPCGGNVDCLPVDAKEPLVLYTGKQEDRKGFCDLIRAASIVIAKNASTKFVLAGHGDIERGKKLAEDLGILASISFPGWISGGEKHKLLQQASIFCLPSYGEGVPISMLEAMNYKLPVIVTPVGGIPDVISDRVNGLLVEPGNVEAIANAINELIENPSYANKISNSGCEYVKTNYSLEVIGLKLTELYEKLC